MSGKPALTPEEWEQERGDGGICRREGVSAEFYAYRPFGTGVVVGITGEPGIMIPDEHGHAVAALLLHEQAYGFTQLDVVRLQAVADATFLNAEGTSNQDKAWVMREVAKNVRSIADRIEALLPPERDALAHERAM